MLVQRMNRSLDVIKIIFGIQDGYSSHNKCIEESKWPFHHFHQISILLIGDYLAWGFMGVVFRGVGLSTWRWYPPVMRHGCIITCYFHLQFPVFLGDGYVDKFNIYTFCSGSILTITQILPLFLLSGILLHLYISQLW